jgi:hypothetical protein
MTLNARFPRAAQCRDQGLFAETPTECGTALFPSTAEGAEARAGHKTVVPGRDRAMCGQDNAKELRRCLPRLPNTFSAIEIFFGTAMSCPPRQVTGEGLPSPIGTVPKIARR